MTVINSTLSRVISFIILIIFSRSVSAQKVLADDPMKLKHNEQVACFSGARTHYVAFRNSSQIRLLAYDTAFKLQYNLTFDTKNIRNNDQLLGGAVTGNILTILFSDKAHQEFSTLTFSLADRHFAKGMDVNIYGSLYLNWFAANKQLSIMGIKDRSSLISIASFDSLGKVNTRQFDLSAENFPRTDLDTAPRKGNYFLAEIIRKPIKRNCSIEYQTDIDMDEEIKMFHNDKEVMITLNNLKQYTRILRLDLVTGAYHSYRVPFSRNNAESDDNYSQSSYLLDHRLYTAMIYPKGLSIGVFDLDSGKYLHEWGPRVESLDSIICGSIIYEKTFYQEVLKRERSNLDDEDYFKERRKFIKKMWEMSALTITASKAANGYADIYVGSASASEAYGGGFMMVGGFGGGMGAPMMVPTAVPTFGGSSSARPGIPAYHTYFTSTLSDKTFQKKCFVTSEANAYRKFQFKYIERKNEKLEKYFALFNLGDRFYLGSYRQFLDEYVILEYR